MTYCIFRTTALIIFVRDSYCTGGDEPAASYLDLPTRQHSTGMISHFHSTQHLLFTLTGRGRQRCLHSLVVSLCMLHIL